MITAALITAPLIAASTATAYAQDAAKGEQVFARCAPCHAVGPNAENKLGPELNGLDGRHSGTAANFSYSDANKNSGIVWGEATFKQYIKAPSAMVPGTKMFFAGVKNDQEINDLWAYLKQFDTTGNSKK
jgi:cytochrome c